MSIANTQTETIIEAGIIDDNDQTRTRVEHLKQLETLVGNSYPNKYERSKISGAEDTISNLLGCKPVAEIAEEFERHKSELSEGEKPNQELKESLNAKLKAFGNVRISGRLAVPPRVMGKAAFVHLSDGVCRLQIYVRRDDAKAMVNGELLMVNEEKSGGSSAADSDSENSPFTINNSPLISGWEVFKLLDHGDFIGAEGFLFLTNTGELSVHVETIQFLSKSLMPMPDKMHDIADPEISRRYRYVDLIASSLRNKTDDEIEEEARTGVKKLTTREVFERRAKLISGMRRFLDDHDYIEVETPMLTPKATGAAAKPFATHHNALDIELYARIAPELYLKRLTVGGFEKVYELNRNFRNEGLSQKHNPEFTMLEFYCAYMDVNGMMDFAEAMIKESVQKATGGSLQVKYGENDIDFSKFERLTMKDAILQRHEQILADFMENDDLKSYLQDSNWLEGKVFVCILASYLQSVAGKKDFNENYLLLAKFVDGDWKTRDFHEVNNAEEIKRHRSEDWTEPVMTQHREPSEIVLDNQRKNWNYFKEKFKGKDISDAEYGNALMQIFDLKVEKELINPTFIIDYPKSISPLSKASPENSQIAERFELFINGMECANGFSELNDPQEQYERFVDQTKERETGDEEAMVLDEDYIRALAYGMPPAAGIGIGIDRLVMLLTNKHSIRDVILFPHLRPERKQEETENES